MTQKYKVVIYQAIPIEPEDAAEKSLKIVNKFHAMEYRTISSGLSWKEAKELRAINTKYVIVPDNKEPVVEPVEEIENA